ncbi:sigma-54 dependent transcriptional regulator [uncultured Paludibaculum sp.]|uniref:sigma-54 interaction domain-containing protein n=1 Tax=uncultured Paludibaculum sp. TaxID=1765020 RepID=UPI002AABD87C|nr:sigma-54 dependent transcriptional regulator [uncultured Paludibaculum sp.]
MTGKTYCVIDELAHATDDMLRMVQPGDTIQRFQRLEDAVNTAVREDGSQFLIHWPYLDWTESCLRGQLLNLARSIQISIYDPHHLISEHDQWQAVNINIVGRGGQQPASPASAAGSPPNWRRWLIGESETMRKIVEMIRIVADRRTTVLLLGETGTGKEAAARAIHEASGRRDQELVPVNCAAIPESLIEAELFGHAKGAYTGAIGARAGYFERAHHGTLLLDEIGEMPLALQGKLLRVLQEREIQRVGGGETVPVDCRVIAASNVDLAEEARLKRFRSDLFYRLSVVVLRLPALRERREDIPVLVDHFIERVCKAEKLPRCRVTPDALRRLADCDWPGNVRQLEHAVESAVVMSDGRTVLTAYDFPIDVPVNEAVPVQSGTGAFPVLPEAGLDMEETVRRLEMHLLSEALGRANGNKARAADLLGLKRTTLLYKARSLGFAIA